MRVAFDGRSLASPVLRGWDRYAIGLVGELVRQGVEVTLFHRKRQPLHPPHIENLGCSVRGLDDIKGLHYEQVSVPLALKRGNFDLFHAPFEHGVPLAAPCPVVLTIHSVTGQSYQDLIDRGKLPGSTRDYVGYDVGAWNWKHFYLRAQIARADHILTPSEFCRDEVVQFLNIPPARVTSTPLAAHEQFLRPPRSEHDRAAVLRGFNIRKPYLLFVGGYEPHKNIIGLLETFALVKLVRPDLSLVLVGTGSAPEALSRRVESLELQPGDDVVFLTNISEELTDLYDEASLVVTLSWRETFCLPILEGMARGIPAVASEWGAASEIMEGTGLLVDPRDSFAAKDAILQLLSPAADCQIRRRTFIAQAKNYSWSRTAAQTLEVYHRLLEQ